MAGKRLHCCKRHGLVDHYVRADGRIARCTICNKHRGDYPLEYQRRPSRVAWRKAYYRRPEVQKRLRTYRDSPEFKQAKKRYDRAYRQKVKREAGTC